MPLYEYLCRECRCEFELLIIGDRVAVCPNCGETRDLEQLASTFAMSIAESRHLRGPAANMFENFTVQHVKDKRTGKPLVVNSLKELRAAEKEHHFALAIASDNNAAASEPPQHEPWAGDISHNYRKKFNRDPKAYISAQAGQGVSVGVGKLDKSRKRVA